MQELLLMKWDVLGMKNINKTHILLILILALLNMKSYAFTIGVIVGQKSSVSSTSNAEKMCILKNMYEDARRENRDIKILFEENDRSARGSVEAALKLVNEKADIVLLPLISNEAEPAADILMRNRIPFLTTATSESVIKNNKLALSLLPENSHQANLLVAYYLKSYQGRRVHVVTDASSHYSIKMGKMFIQKLVERRPDVQFDEHVLRFRDFNFNDVSNVSFLHDGDVIFAPLFNPQIAMLYTWLSGLGVKNISIIGPDSIGARSEFYDIVGDLHENVNLYFLKNWNGELKGPYKNTLNSYVRTYCPDKKSTFVTTYSFDLINTILQNYSALKDVRGEKLISLLRQVHYITAMDGSIYHFGETGYNKKPMYLYKASNKGNIFIETFLAGDEQ